MTTATAERALMILDIIAASPEPLGVTEISRRIGEPIGTVFRSLEALEKSGYIARYQASARYIVGDASRRLRAAFLARFRIRDVCMPYLRQLCFATGETVSLIVPFGDNGIRLAALTGAHEIVNSRPIGEIAPLTNTLGGRVILAFRASTARVPPSVAPRNVRSTIESPAAIRARGFAIEEMAFAPGMAAIAFPIRSPEKVAGAVSIEGAVFDLKRRKPVVAIARAGDVVAQIERLARSNPSLFNHPYEHLAFKSS
jgi:DNA-binding IclR family transcriptional regulator